MSPFIHVLWNSYCWVGKILEFMGSQGTKKLRDMPTFQTSAGFQWMSLWWVCLGTLGSALEDADLQNCVQSGLASSPGPASCLATWGGFSLVMFGLAARTRMSLRGQLSRQEVPFVISI